jgi:hypothetical protein
MQYETSFSFDELIKEVNEAPIKRYKRDLADFEKHKERLRMKPRPRPPRVLGPEDGYYQVLKQVKTTLS